MKENKTKPHNTLRIAINTAMLFIIIGASIATGYTISTAGNTNNSTSSMPTRSQDGNQNGGPGGGQMGTPPARPGENSDSANDESERPTPPDQNTGDSSEESTDSDNQDQTNTPPDLPSGTAPSDMNGDFSGNTSQQITGSDSVNLEMSDYIILGVESLIIALFSAYLILSDFNHKTPKETLKGADRVLIYLFSTLIVAGIIFGINILVANMHP